MSLHALQMCNEMRVLVAAVIDVVFNIVFFLCEVKRDFCNLLGFSCYFIFFASLFDTCMPARMTVAIIFGLQVIIPFFTFQIFWNFFFFSHQTKEMFSVLCGESLLLFSLSHTSSL